MECEHVYQYINGHFECIECDLRVEYDIMTRDTEVIE